MTRRNNRRSAVSRRAIRTNANRQRLNCAVSPELEALRNNEELLADYTDASLDAIIEAADYHLIDAEDVLLLSILLPFIILLLYEINDGKEYEEWLYNEYIKTLEEVDEYE